MSIERLKSIKEQLMSCVESQMHNLQDVDAEELGEAVDMVKDMEEAIYYCTIVEAMKETDNKETTRQPVNNTYYYGGGYPIYYDMDQRRMDRRNDYMYYDGQTTSMPSTATTDSRHMYYDNVPNTTTIVPSMRDSREGRSPTYRKMYMEGQEKNKSKDEQMKELDRYIQELSSDITEMIVKASPEEKAVLRQKITTLANKIA